MNYRRTHGKGNYRRTHNKNLREFNFEGADFRGTKRWAKSEALKGIDINGANLSGAHLQHTDLRGSRFTNVDLSNAILTNADLRGANLYCTNLHGAYLKGAKTSGMLATFDDWELPGPGWRLLEQPDGKETLVGPWVNIDGANLSGADGVDLLANKVSAVLANFRGADLRGADFRGANLTGADFRGANLTGAKLEDAKTSGIIWDDDTNFSFTALVGLDGKGHWVKWPFCID